jgi:hypothetical protein
MYSESQTAIVTKVTRCQVTVNNSYSGSTIFRLNKSGDWSISYYYLRNDVDTFDFQKEKEYHIHRRMTC